MQQGKKRNIEQRQSYLVAGILDRNCNDQDKKPKTVGEKCLVQKIQIGMAGMNYPVDQAAAAQDQETGPDQEDPAALDMVTAELKVAGPECPDCNQQTYKSDKNLLANMIIQQEFF